jgi:hypothetical protein
MTNVGDVSHLYHLLQSHGSLLHGALSCMRCNPLAYDIG